MISVKLNNDIKLSPCADQVTFRKESKPYLIETFHIYVYIWYCDLTIVVQAQLLLDKVGRVRGQLL